MSIYGMSGANRAEARTATRAWDDPERRRPIFDRFPLDPVPVTDERARRQWVPRPSAEGPAMPLGQALAANTAPLVALVLWGATLLLAATDSPEMSLGLGLVNLIHIAGRHGL